MMSRVQMSEFRCQSSDIKPILCRLLSVICLLSSALCLLSSVCHAEVSSSTELINSPRSQAVKYVTYRGEVIGDVMLRGDYAWVNINDGQNAIGIWMPKNFTQEIKFSGSYKSIGDFIEINGIFNRTCHAHGGDLDIHATKIKILRPGYEISENISSTKFKLTIILFVICLVVIMFYFIKIGYRKKK